MMRWLSLVLILLALQPAHAGWPIRGGGPGVAPPPAPVITSPTTASGVVGSPFSYNITATNSPTSYGATGLPSPLSVDTSTGAITGTPTTAATTSATVSATNAGGTGSGPLGITINPMSSYTGPCDVVTCAEAYSMGYAMKDSYVGALIQIQRTSDNAMMDIPQNLSTRKADLTGVNTFCAATSCLYFKIYAQIQGHANDIVLNIPASNYVNYEVDGTTGLPIFDATNSCCGGGTGKYDIGGTDGTLTGIPGGVNAASIFYLGAPLQETYCCGVFGLTHAYTDPDTIGTDYMMILGYGWFNGGGTGVNVNCATTTTFCMGAEEESANDVADYSSTLFANTFSGIAYDPSAGMTGGTVAGFINNVNLFSHSPPVSVVQASLPLSPGNHLHLNSGGDGSGPANAVMREAIIMNFAATYGQFQAVFANIQARYPGLTFPSVIAAPVVTSATTASGTVGFAFSYNITATNSPTSFNAAGLPSWASVSTSTGAITGTPDVAATISTTVSATNARGTGSGPLSITINNPGSYTGPCDIVSCAEGWSLNSAVTASYAGPLFQYVVGDGTTDISTATKHDAAQNGSHAVDIPALQALCGSTLTNCILTTIYAQIHTTSNDLPSAPHGAFNNCGNNTNCAAQLTLDSTNTVVQIDAGIAQSRLNFNESSQYTIAGDALATGISGGTGSISVMVNMHMTGIQDPCCGFFGISHLWSDPDINGTDFILAILYDSRYGPPCASGNLSDYCVNLDLEGAHISPTTGAVISTTLKDLVYFGTTDGTPSWNTGTWINGTAYINGTVLGGLNVPAHVHLGGGGDLTLPAPTTFREGLIWNVALTPTNEAAIFANEQTRYPGLSFP